MPGHLAGQAQILKPRQHSLGGGAADPGPRLGLHRRHEGLCRQRRNYLGGVVTLDPGGGCVGPCGPVAQA